MYYLYQNEALDYPTIVKAETHNEAMQLLDENFGFVLGWYTDSNDNASALVRDNGLTREFVAERVNTLGIEYGTDGEEFAELFA